MSRTSRTSLRPRARGNRPRRVPVVILMMLLVLWPLTYRYTSVGVDVDTDRGETVESRFYRLRWPGDGTMRVGWIDEHRSAEAAPANGIDLGALVLQPPRGPTPRSTWNTLGFWYEDVAASEGDRPSEAAPRADRVLLAGVPHWLLVAAAAAVVLARRRERPDTIWRSPVRATER